MKRAASRSFRRLIRLPLDGLWAIFEGMAWAMLLTVRKDQDHE